MKSDPVFLGIDTSNYTTSAAAVDAHGNILADNRRLLEVKREKKGSGNLMLFFSIGRLSRTF